MHPTYKRMLEGMRKKEKKRKSRKKDPWFLYILKCKDGSFYTGIAKDILKRFQAHSTGKGAKYTRARLPLELIYQESCKGRSAALIRECAVKALSKKKKEALVLKRVLRKKLCLPGSLRRDNILA